MPGIVTTWYGGGIPWVLSGTALTFGDEESITLWKWKDGDFSSDLSGGLENEISFDPVAGTIKGSMGGTATLDISLDLTPVEILGEAGLGLDASLAVSFPGDGNPTITPAWNASLSGKIGVGAEVVPIVADVLGAGELIDPLIDLPVIGDILKGPQLRLYLTLGGSLEGDYSNFQIGNCFLGTDSVSGAVTLGLEGQAGYFGEDAEVYIYAGVSGSRKCELCPKLTFDSVTMSGYVGASATLWGRSWQARKGIEVTWDGGGSVSSSPLASANLTSAALTWQPICRGCLNYGAMNRPASTDAVQAMSATPADETADSGAETIIENVTPLSGPSIMADSTGTEMLFTLYDPSKPSYAASDIASLCLSGGSWTQDLVTDDQLAESNPKIVAIDANTALAAWTYVTGNVSGVTNPSQIAPYLDIAAAFLNRQTGQWSAVRQITSNSVVDRDPLPVVFGSNQGILWIENAGDAAPGNAASGDMLMYSGWSGTAWSSPEILWSALKGILGLAFTADSAGQGYAVFEVDEDGELDTTTDQELYEISTSGGVWGSATQVTSDSVGDSLPVLVAPNGVPICVWSYGGTLTYSRLDTWNPRPVYSQYTISNAANTLDGVTMPGGAAIAYAAQLPAGVDIVASFYDADLDS